MYVIPHTQSTQPLDVPGYGAPLTWFRDHNDFAYSEGFFCHSVIPKV